MKRTNPEIYEYGRSVGSRLNPDIAEMMKLLGEEFEDDHEFENFGTFFEEKGTCERITHVENGVNWCDDEENEKSVCSLLCQTGMQK